MKTAKKEIKGKNRPIVFDMTSNQCVWASSGVITPSHCINAFNCLSCPLDKTIQKRVIQKGIAKGPACDIHLLVNERVVKSQTERKCRHMLSGRVSYKYCINNYDCTNCTYHQLIEEETISLSVARVDHEYAGGFCLAGKYYYHRGHAWARIEYGGRVRIGLDDFAMRLVGRLDDFKLPDLGTTIYQGKPEIGITRGDLKAETLSPIEGIVVAVNPTILENAGIANQDPYGEGWLMVIEPMKLKINLKNLIFAEESTAWIEDESSRLASLVTEETSYKLAATGGRAVNDIYGQIPEIGWDKLVKEFLLTG